MTCPAIFFYGLEACDFWASSNVIRFSAFQVSSSFTWNRVIVPEAFLVNFGKGFAQFFHSFASVSSSFSPRFILGFSTHTYTLRKKSEAGSTSQKKAVYLKRHCRYCRGKPFGLTRATIRMRKAFWRTPLMSAVRWSSWKRPQKQSYSPDRYRMANVSFFFSRPDATLD